MTAVSQWYLEDFTGSRWTVGGAVNKWDNRPNYYRIYWVNGGDCNHAVVHCVPVREGNYGTGWYGQTTFTVHADGNNHIVHDSMLMRLNNQLTTTAAQRESVACHEAGHTSGGFDDSGRNTNSCMYGTDAEFPLDPATHDFNVLELNYNH